jgi:pilus assembly protein CpaB
MSVRTVVVILLALVCGLSAVAGVRQLRDQGSAVSKEGMISVVAAATDLPRGVMVAKDCVKLVELPEKDVPPDAVKTVDEVLNRAVVIPLLKDDLIRDAKLGSKDGSRGLAALVPKGMRAYTILTPNIASGVAGFILPGNKVDVLLTVAEQTIRDEYGGGTTTTLLQRIEVLAVDDQIDAPAENRVDSKEMRSVTLLVTPNQAGMLSLAQTKGTLHLSLRSDGDATAADAEPVFLKDLRLQRDVPEDQPTVIDVSYEEETVKPRPRNLRIRTFRGAFSGVVPVEQSAERSD